MKKSVTEIANDLEEQAVAGKVDVKTAKQAAKLLRTSVQQEVLDDVRWQRDQALSQLEEIGKFLGSKMDDVATPAKINPESPAVHAFYCCINNNCAECPKHEVMLGMTDDYTGVCKGYNQKVLKVPESLCREVYQIVLAAMANQKADATEG